MKKKKLNLEDFQKNQLRKEQAVRILGSGDNTGNPPKLDENGHPISNQGNGGG